MKSHTLISKYRNLSLLILRSSFGHLQIEIKMINNVSIDISDLTAIAIDILLLILFYLFINRPIIFIVIFAIINYPWLTTNSFLMLLKYLILTSKFH